MNPARLFLLVASLSFSLSAWAQYQWIDHNGRRVFSDRPPPADIADKNILAQPGAKLPPPTAQTSAPNDAAAEADAATPQDGAQASAPASGVDPALQKELDKKQQQAEAAEAAEQKAQEQRQAATRADNCRRARNAVATLESGRRIAQVNEKGEREIMSDTQRQTDLAHARQMVRDNCN